MMATATLAPPDAPAAAPPTDVPPVLPADMHDWQIGAPVTAAAFLSLEDDRILDRLEALQRAHAWLAAQEVALIEVMAARRRAESRAFMGVDATHRGISLVDHEAAVAVVAVVDEIALATGLDHASVNRRVALACHDPARTAPVRQALASGLLSLTRAIRFHERTVILPPDALAAALDRLLAPYPQGRIATAGGLHVPHRVFAQRLSRAVAAGSTDRARHEHALAQRDAHAALYTEDGVGQLAISGHAARVAAAIDRIDRIARNLRREGDSRTIAQLRSDIGLDLLQHGEIASATQEPARGESAAEVARRVGPYAGALPAARVTVTVSAASLLGVNEAPGTVDLGDAVEHLPAQVVRDMAYAAGSTWRRLITDPATGYIQDLSTHTYAVTGQLRERVLARDRVSRVPGSVNPARRCDLDHEIDWAAGGPSSESNLSATCRSGHNHKTRGTWTSTREPGIHGAVTWTTGAGRTYRSLPWDYRDPEPPAPPRGRLVYGSPEFEARFQRIAAAYEAAHPPARFTTPAATVTTSATAATSATQGGTAERPDRSGPAITDLGSRTRRGTPAAPPSTSRRTAESWRTPAARPRSEVVPDQSATRPVQPRAMRGPVRRSRQLMSLPFAS